MTTRDLLLVGSVRLSMLLMLAAWLLLLRPPRNESLARACWTAGFLALLIHLWAAFHYVHHWSHAAAVADTARRTRELLGLDAGWGVWANDLFALVWGADVFWWTLFSDRRRPRWISTLVHGFLGFIAFNATVVFASGFSRWLGLAGCALLIMVLVWRNRITR